LSSLLSRQLVLGTKRGLAMKVGDLVKFKGEDENEPGAAKGLLVDMRQLYPVEKRYSVAGEIGVMWDFLDGEIGWQQAHEIEVISESR
jgi:hypothetical protein